MNDHNYQLSAIILMWNNLRSHGDLYQCSARDPALMINIQFQSIRAYGYSNALFGEQLSTMFLVSDVKSGEDETRRT